jgi:hypothetical protein
LITRHKIRPDGKTGYEDDSRQRASPDAVSGESAVSAGEDGPEPQVRVRRLPGRAPESNELLVATDDGVIKVRTIKRIPDQHIAEAVLLSAVPPWRR